MEYVLWIVGILAVNQIIYDRYVQRKHSLLINYPLIGRMRYVFEALREPFRQYFGDENFYESKDKVDWVYQASKDKVNYASFSPNQPQPNPKFLIKHANAPLNEGEVSKDFSVTFGPKRKYPFKSRSIIARSAMSDGSISPEGTRAFAKGAFDGNFPINTGEGSLTSNFFITHKTHEDAYMDKIEVTGINRVFYFMVERVFNRWVAISLFRWMFLAKGYEDTYIFDPDSITFFRPNWDAPIESYPDEVPSDLPDIIFQMSSGLFGVRDKNGEFSENRYAKVMKFCKMTEIKLAQGAKQTGGKLLAEKVTQSISYYRGIEPNKSVFSPNRFPYAKTTEELFDFVEKLQKISEKPVGFKIVISDKSNIEEYAKEMKKRKDEGRGGIPDFITIDGGDGGSATAPLSLMERVGLHVKDSLYIANEVLKEYGVRDEVKIIAAGKILTPGDAVIALSLGADFIYVARGFMMSAGCIRARMCAGTGSHKCPVGLATQDKKLRGSFLVYKQAREVTNYHKNLLHEIEMIMAVMGVKHHSELTPEHLTFIDKNGFIYNDVNRYFDKKIN
ncbi:MAG: FMN-binding glutamate synthase family protein [Campylobacterales bacterium]|nr:FMN-binding glutamate synthase family protein [Campylobacterales bacterium]